MCDSRYQRVVAPPINSVVRVQDADEIERNVSLLAYDGDEPCVNDWLVVHSGYALAMADPDQATAAIADIRAARARLTDAASTELKSR
jgi:hydrogenase maturation factor